ncbi:MAG: hypothetical protein M3N52_01360, partial [Actinomycetota bacterium]|nr:hypothetical protein [Actinomycetota bacterium]
VGLDERMAWTEARLTYLAAEADRFLTVQLRPTGGVQERPTLATLGLKPVSARGLQQLPPMPTNAREPAALARAARSALIECGVDQPTRGVLYATGAPASWDGQRWADPPVWTATVTGPKDSGVVVDPVSGAQASGGCLQPTGS